MINNIVQINFERNTSKFEHNYVMFIVILSF